MDKNLHITKALHPVIAKWKSFALISIFMCIIYWSHAQISFVEIPTNIENVYNSSSSFADVDNDGDQDILIIGENTSNERFANLYINNGFGTFTLQTNQPFVGVSSRAESVAFADVDNDLDQDVIIAGKDTSNTILTTLYLNDGTGNYSISASSNFRAVANASVVFGDFFKDGNIDVLIAGDSVSLTYSEVYQNDGTGVFSNPSPYLGSFFSSTDTADINGNGFLDVAMNSWQLGSFDNTQLYIGDGAGSFVYPAQNYFNAYLGIVRLRDVNQDGFADLIVTGGTTISTSTNSTAVYLNDGTGGFTELFGHGLLGVNSGDMELADLDNDGDLDLVMAGVASGVGTSEILKTYIYENNGDSTFSMVTTIDPIDLKKGSVSIADVNGDSLPDIYLNGQDSLGNPRSILYKLCYQDSVVLNEQVCDSYIFDSDTLTTSGTYQTVFTNQAGCDSVVTLHLTVLSETHYKNIYTSNSFYELGDDIITTSGDYHDTLSNMHGCDSIIFLSLNFQDSSDHIHSGDWFELIMPDSTPQLEADFDALTEGHIRVGDLDGDNDQDVIMSGVNRVDEFGRPTIASTLVYFNDGQSNFIEAKNTGITERYEGDMELFDADGDGDLDLLQAGWVPYQQELITLDLNDGSGGFTTLNGTGLPDLSFGSLAVGDLDGDSDIDIVITGMDSTNTTRSQIFYNQGNGIFDEDTLSTLTPLTQGGLAIGDMNGDSLMDIVMTGKDGSNVTQNLIYLRDTLGKFNLYIGANLGQVNSQPFLIDVDGNNTLDIILRKKLYLNDGTATFTLDPSNALGAFVNAKNIVVDDFNQDSIQDLAFFKKAQSQILIGDGVGGFSLLDSLIGHNNGGVASGDLNGDGFPEVIMTGVIEIDDRVDAELYVNDGTGRMNRNELSLFQEVGYGEAQFADLDGDGDQDLVTTGDGLLGLSIYTSEPNITGLYWNDGTGNFTQDTSHGMINVRGPVLLKDFNGDTHIDILLTGYEYNSTSASSYSGATGLYLNNGLGQFTLKPNIGISYGTSYNIVAGDDVDQDGDVDLVINGSLKLNDGTGVFTNSTNHDITGISYGTMTFGDVNNDGYPDLYRAGEGASNNDAGKLYINDGTGGLYHDSDSQFIAMIGGTVNIVDIDGDNDNDIFVAGWRSPFNSIHKESVIYINDGSGNFTEDQFNSIVNVGDADSEFSDLDGDGDLDLIVSGIPESGVKSVTKLYTNDGGGHFQEYADAQFTKLRGSALAIADIDNNGSNDIFISGYRRDTESRIYRNILCQELAFNDTTRNLVAQACERYFFYGQELTNTGIYQHVENSFCGTTDTTILDLQILQEHSIINTDACENYSFDGTLLTTSGTYNATFINQAGCDSSVTLNLTILQPTSSAEVIETCDSYDWNGTVYTSSGTYQEILTNSVGCDSTASLQLTILNSYSSVQDVDACNSYTWHGTVYTTSGTYLNQHTSVSGCDSSETLNLTILTSDLVNQQLDHCGDYQFGSQLLTASGTYIETFTNQAGCDSVVTLTFEHIPLPLAEVTTSGGQLIATEVTGATYQWYDCATNDSIPGATSRQLTSVGTGDYSVEVNDRGCTTLSACVFYDPVSSIFELKDRTISIYPTHTNGSVFLDLDGEVKDVSILVFSVDGKLIRSYHHKTVSRSEIKIEGNTGVYFIQINIEGESPITKRIVKY